MSAEREEIANEVFHGIPSDEKLKSMSFSDLAVECGDCPKDSPKFKVIEREMKKHLAKDQAKINLPNILIGAGIGLAGVVLGAYLRNFPCSENQVSPSTVVNQGPQIPPSVINVPSINPPAGHGAVGKPPAQNNGQH
jgi:hypothetical protein